MNSSKPQKWWHLSLAKQIFLGLAVGILLGWLLPEWAVKTEFLRTIFLNMVKSIIAPLIFASIVSGIAGGGDHSTVGRMGFKALIYFEVVTALALVIGLATVNLIGPGFGVSLKGDAMDIGSVGEHHPLSLQETIVHAFPINIVESMVHNDVLQIVVFSVMFAFAVSAIGEKGKPILAFCEALAQEMFRFTSYVMHFAPFGVGAAMAVTISEMGVGVLANLGMLIGTLYLALVVFVVVVFGAVAYLRSNRSSRRLKSRSSWLSLPRAANRPCQKPWKSWSVSAYLSLSSVSCCRPAIASISMAAPCIWRWPRYLSRRRRNPPGQRILAWASKSP
jgi:proton glutamate symport protein